MKVVAWADRGAGDPRDAIDLAILLRHYANAGNEDRLYGTDMAVLEAANYDFQLAGARLLGMDARAITGAATRGEVLAITDDLGRLERLVRDVARDFRAAEDPIAAAGGLLAQFKAGLREGRADPTSRRSAP